MGQSFNSIGNGYGATTGTTAVVIVPSPGGSVVRVAKTIRLTNLDTVSHDYTLLLHDSVGPVTAPIAKKSSVAAGDFIDFDGECALTSATQEFQIIVDAGANTTESSWYVMYADYA